MKKLSNRDIIWSYLGQIANLTVHILLTPLIAIRLSANELGLWYTFTSIYTLVTFFDTSFSPLILKNATYCISGAKELTNEGFCVQNIGSPNYDLLNELVCVAKNIYRLVSITFFLLLIFAGSPYIIYITKGQMDISCLGAWFLYALGIGINFFIIYMPSILKGIGYIADAQKIFVISRSIQLIVSIIGIMMGGGVYALSFGFLLASLLIFFLSVRLVNKISFLKFRSENFEKSRVREIVGIIWYNAKKMVLVTIGRYFSTQGGILICSTFISLEMSGAYGLTMQALQAVASISNIYLQTLIPSISAASIRDDQTECKESFSGGIFVFWLLYPTGVFLVGTICNPLLNILHANTMLLEPAPFFVIAFGYFFLSNYVNFNIIYESRNRIPHMKAEFGFGIINLCGMVLFCWLFRLGIWGIIINQTVLPLLYNAWHWPGQVVKLLNSNIKEMIVTGSYKIRRQFLKQ